jgi:ATP-dependent Clp protease, protease subunit
VTLPPPPGTPFPYVGPGGGEPLRPPERDVRLERSLYERMLDERVVFVSGVLDDEVANLAAFQLMTLDACGDDEVQLHVDCRRSSIDAALALMDVIDTMGVEVRATCTGLVHGPVFGVVAVCRYRRAMLHSRFALTEPRIEVSGRAGDLQARAQYQRSRIVSFRERVGEACGRAPEEIESAVRATRYLSAQEAKDFGIVDEVLRPDARIVQMPRSLGFRRR